MKSIIEWRRWGQTDPLYAAVSWTGKQKTGAHPWTEEEFLASGALDWEDYRQQWQQWQQYGLNKSSCVEIGCGPGRMILPLSRHFERVYAVDISEEMIDRARPHVQEKSVHFCIADGNALPLSSRSVCSVFSTQVFQHFEHVSQGAACFGEIFRILAPCGTMMVQLPLCAWPRLPWLYRPVYVLQKALGQLRADCRRYRLRRRQGKLFMRMLSYEASWLYTTLSRIGFENIQV